MRRVTTMMLRWNRSGLVQEAGSSVIGPSVLKIHLDNPGKVADVWAIVAGASDCGIAQLPLLRWRQTSANGSYPFALPLVCRGRWPPDRARRPIRSRPHDKAGLGGLWLPLPQQLAPEDQDNKLGPFILVSIPASISNQSPPDSGVPNRFKARSRSGCRTSSAPHQWLACPHR
jgi:hypothetical protein